MNNGDPSGEGGSGHDRCFCSFELYCFNLEGRNRSLHIPRNGCGLHRFFVEQLPHLFAVQSWASVSCRPQRLPLEGDADLIDEQHHGFGIFF